MGLTPQQRTDFETKGWVPFDLSKLVKAADEAQ